LLRLRAGFAAQAPDFVQIAARPIDGTALDEGFTLAGKRIDVGWLDSQRIGIMADRLARKPLRLSDPAERDIGAAIARIDDQRGFQKIDGLVMLAGGTEASRLLDEGKGIGVNLIVRALPETGARQGRPSDGQ